MPSYRVDYNFKIELTKGNSVTGWGEDIFLGQLTREAIEGFLDLIKIKIYQDYGESYDKNILTFSFGQQKKMWPVSIQIVNCIPLVD